jgi:precorrin-6Y C5,15-methyltransferase (decarboxylating)
MARWLTLIGTPADGIAGLAPSARDALRRAEIVIVPRRLAGDPLLPQVEIHTWPSPFSAMVETLESWRGRKVVILATGDPFHFGVGAVLAKNFTAEDMHVLPSPSAFSLAAARLGWPLQEVEMISLHGRPVSLLSSFLQPGARIMALTAGAQTVGEVAALLQARGFGPSRLSVLQDMGADYERIDHCAPADAAALEFSDFNILAIECVSEPGAALLARVPGLPDDAFTHDGQLTKREVRAITVAALGPTSGALLWDVGAGCGSVAIEWMRAARGAAVNAFERDEKRLAMIAANAAALGVPGLRIVAGKVPETFVGMPQPDAVFIGGAIASDEVFQACWSRLKSGGRLVANAVTLEGQQALGGYYKAHGGDLVRIEVSQLDKVGSRHAMRPRMAVLQYRVVKP